MNTRWMAVLAAVLAFAAVLVPLAAEDSQAAEGDTPASLADDIIINTSNDLGRLDVSLASGGTSREVFVLSNSGDRTLVLSIAVSRTTGLPSDVSITSTSMTVGDVTSPSLVILKPNDIATVTVTFSAGLYANTSSSSGVIYMAVTDAFNEDPAEYIGIPIVVSVESVFTAGDAYNKFFGVFPNTLPEPFNEPWMTAIITLILWTLATILVSEIIIPLITRLAKSKKSPEERKSITKRLTAAITAVMFMMALEECTQIVGAGASIQHMVGACAMVVYVLLGAYIAWMVYLFIITMFLKGLDETADVDGMDMSLLPLFKMIGKIAIAVVAVMAALSAFGVDLAGILVSAGVVSLGITLGAQETLNQFFSGIVLLASRPFKKGDFVKINDTVYRVRRVRLMYTELENWDFDQIITMPNNKVSTATVVNLSSDYHRTRVFIYIDVAYDSDLDKVKESLEKAGRKHPHVIQDGSCVPPNARLTEFGDSGIVFRLACYVDDFNNSAHYAGQLRELVMKQLTEDGIEVPYERIQVDILSTPGTHQERRASNY